MALFKLMQFFALCLLVVIFIIWSSNKMMSIKIPKIQEQQLNMQEQELNTQEPNTQEPTTQEPITYTNSLYFYKDEPVYKQNFHFTLRERLKCKRDTFLVIMVTSRPTGVKERQAIRQSWGSKNSWWGKRILTLFFLGQGKERYNNSGLSLKEESTLYGDIIQQDFLDTYYNLTLKTIMAFRWVTKFCSNTSYAMKTDSDVFINTGNLVKYLLNVTATENLFTGYPMIEARCFRTPSKFFVTQEEYPFEIFPPYCHGSGYVFDIRLAQKVYEIMAHVKPVKFEDVYVGICLNLLKVNITFPRDNELFLIDRIAFNISVFSYLITAHRTNPDEMIAYWDLITKNSSFSFP